MSFLFGKGSKVAKVSDLVKAIKDALASIEKNSKGNEKVRPYYPLILIASLKMHLWLYFWVNRHAWRASKLLLRNCSYPAEFCPHLRVSIENTTDWS